MNVTNITPVASAAQIDSLSVSNDSSREVSQSEEAAFKSLQSIGEAEPHDSSSSSTDSEGGATKVTMDDVMKKITESIQNNIIQTQEQDRQQLKEAMEGEG